MNPGTAGQATYALLFGVFWLSELLVGGFLRAGRADRIDDRGSSLLLMIVFPLTWVLGPALATVRQASFATPLTFGLGLGVAVAGQLLRWWSIATLGRLFTVNVAIRDGHRLVDTGPYRLVRHPSYTAILLVHLGMGLLLGNLLSILVFTVPTAAALVVRIRVEEDVLLAGLGESYREYMNRTKRLMPGVY